MWEKRGVLAESFGAGILILLVFYGISPLAEEEKKIRDGIATPIAKDRANYTER